MDLSGTQNKREAVLIILGIFIPDPYSLCLGAGIQVETGKEAHVNWWLIISRVISVWQITLFVFQQISQS
jgi:hypothetical protein